MADYQGTGYDQVAAYLPASGVYAIQPTAGLARPVPAVRHRREPASRSPSRPTTTAPARPTSPSTSPPQGVFAIQDPTGKTAGEFVQFGIAGAGQSIPAPADYYGTGQADIAVYLAQAGVFAIQDPTGKTAGEVIPFGKPGLGQSIPVPGDYDGSGQTELAVYVPSLGAFFYRPANGSRRRGSCRSARRTRASPGSGRLRRLGPDRGGDLRPDARVHRVPAGQWRPGRDHVLRHAEQRLDPGGGAGGCPAGVRGPWLGLGDDQRDPARLHPLGLDGSGLVGHDHFYMRRRCQRDRRWRRSQRPARSSTRPSRIPPSTTNRLFI